MIKKVHAWWGQVNANKIIVMWGWASHNMQLYYPHLLLMHACLFYMPAAAASMQKLTWLLSVVYVIWKQWDSLLHYTCQLVLCKFYNYKSCKKLDGAILYVQTLLVLASSTGPSSLGTRLCLFRLTTRCCVQPLLVWKSHISLQARHTFHWVFLPGKIRLDGFHEVLFIQILKTFDQIGPRRIVCVLPLPL